MARMRYLPGKSNGAGGRLCRFCLGEGRGGPDNEDLVAPCPCKGKRSLAHPACLLASFTLRQDKLNFTCQTCGNLYEGRTLLMVAEASRKNLSLEKGSRSPSVARALYHIGIAHK